MYSSPCQYTYITEIVENERIFTTLQLGDGILDVSIHKVFQMI
jgi:hypothetical protein